MTGILGAMLGAGVTVYTVDLSTLVNVSDSSGPPGPSYASFTVQRNGQVTYANAGGSAPSAKNWVSPKHATIGDDYEVRVTLDLGDAPTTGTTGSWLALSSDRFFEWRIPISSPGTLNATVTIAIGLVGTSTAIDSKTITVSVTELP